MSQYGGDVNKYKNDEEASYGYTWQEVWTMVLTKPGVDTFKKILNDPQATAERAYKWIFWTGTVGMLISTIIAIFQLSSVRGARVDIGAALPSLGCGMLIVGIVCVVFFAIGNAITQFIARMLGGEGEYGDFQYVAGAYSAPLIMVNIAVSAFTSPSSSLGFLAIINLALTLYQFALQVMAVKAVNNFGWGKALVTVLIPVVIIVVIFLAVAPSLMSSLTRY
jgi:hypothetical protein